MRVGNTKLISTVTAHYGKFLQAKIITHLQSRELAQRLVAYQLAAADELEANEPVVLQVSEKLRRRLSTFAGAQGFRSLLSRALVLAKAEVPAINGMRVKPDGSLDGFREIKDLVQAEAVGIEILAQLLRLLFTFIGQRLTLNLVVDEWPDFQVNNIASIENSKNEPTR